LEGPYQPEACQRRKYHHYIPSLFSLFDRIREAQEAARNNLVQAKIHSKRYYDKRIDKSNKLSSWRLYIPKDREI